MENPDVCICGHNIQEHEAVGDCKCYVYGCQCDGFEEVDSDIDLSPTKEGE